MKNINKLTVKELYQIAKEKQVTGRSKMNKQELVKAITSLTEAKASQIDKAKQFLQSKKQNSKRKAERKQKNWLNLDLQFFASDKVDFTEGLNDDQKKSVETIDGTTQICSVAGSGKTRVLTHRLGNMIINHGINPKNILVTTFTKKASEEMTERLEGLIDSKHIEEMTIGTTHSIGYRILKEELVNTNNPQKKAFTKGRDGILQGWKYKKLVKELAEKLKKKYKNVFESELQEAIGEIKVPMYTKAVGHYMNNNISPSEAWEIGDSGSARMTLYKEFYEMYAEEKQKMGVIDFDDMLYLTVRLFQQDSDVLKKYQNLYKYILVDEAQDNNLLQYSLVKMLSHPQYNVFIVGDDDQSLYKFRGASPESFIGLDDSYNDVKKIFLDINYRSNSDILDKANMLIKYNNNRIEKVSTPFHKSDDKSVFYDRYVDEDEEATDRIDELMTLKEEGVEYKDIAFLYRTNAQSRAIEDKMILKGIPYILHGGVSFYKRAEIQDLISYFQLAYDTSDNKAFKRVYNKPNRYLGNAFINKLEESNRTNLYKGMSSMTFGRWASGCREIENIVKRIKDNDRKADIPLTKSLEFIMENGGYKDWLLGEDFESEADSNKLENIMTLEHLLSQFDTLEEFVKHLEKVTGNKKISDNSVHLMTIHKSKGLEFDTVFFIGVSENILPHARCLEETMENENKGKNPIEEERRLAYVAVTRAEKRCFISSIETYNGKEAGESRFITEMELLTEEEESDNVVPFKKAE